MLTDTPTTNFDDEIAFWSRQLDEHALFLDLGLTEPALKVRAGELRAAWRQFRDGLSRLATRDAATQAVALAMELRSFQNHLLERLNKGQWIGWLAPLFIDHLRREGDYFIARLQHQAVDPGVECQTWLQFMAEHAAFAAHLLDPTEATKIRHATAFIGEFERLHGGCLAINASLLDLSTKATAQLDAYLGQLGVGTPALRSTIHPVLAEHVLREGQRFLGVITRLRSQLTP